LRKMFKNQEQLLKTLNYKLSTRAKNLSIINMVIKPELTSILASKPSKRTTLMTDTVALEEVMSLRKMVTARATGAVIKDPTSEETTTMSLTPSMLINLKTTRKQLLLALRVVSRLPKSQRGLTGRSNMLVKTAGLRDSTETEAIDKREAAEETEEVETEEAAVKVVKVAKVASEEEEEMKNHPSRKKRKFKD
jgi:hypothetical protein